MLTERHLEDAIKSLRSNLRSEALSTSARTRIFDSARRPMGKFEAFAFLFPRARVATALAFPLVLTLALLLSLPSSIAPGRQGGKLVASKNGEDVVFTVANGHKQHRVFKSTDPTRFGVKEVPEVAGRFSDRADNGVELVFYRVD